MNIKIEATTTGFIVRKVITSRTGRESTRVLGRAKTYSEVDIIIARHQAANPQVRPSVQV